MWIRVLRVSLVLVVVLALAYLLRDSLLRPLFRAAEPPAGQGGVALADLQESDVETVAVDLEVPWEVAFLPGGDLLVTERPGRLVRLPNPGSGQGPVSPADGARWSIPGVREVGEGGLMGLALHPEFAENGWVYVMLTGEGAGGVENRVERYRLTEEGPTDRTVILGDIPGARFHDGGRIAFGPDGMLYVTTGDATEAQLAQDRESLAGKILRLDEEGGAAPDNPFDTRVWSWGHRNPQGLAWDDRDQLWSTEHGRSGLQSGLDEVNRIQPGLNYGWPEIQGDEDAPDMEPPVVHSGPEYTWAPAGAAWWEGRLFFAGLRGEALYEVRPQETSPEPRAHFHGDYGRIRAVRVGPDGALYFSTSNRDGRGRVRDGDDKILRLAPRALPR